MARTTRLLRFLCLLLLAGGSATLPAYAQQQEPVKESYDRLFKTDTDALNAGQLREKELRAAENDTLQSISLREFGTIGLWRHIAEHNKLDINNALSVGQLIKIPQIYYRPREFAEVIYAHGDNQYLAADGSDARALSRKDQIFLNDEIRTGENGFASVLFRTGATVNLQPSSHVKLVKLSCLESDPQCFINLDASQGELVIDVPAQSEQNGSGQENLFHIDTPHASAAVRGTHFDVSSASTGMLVGVTEGAVAIIAKADEVDLPTGFGLKAVQDIPLGEPVELLPATSIRSLPPRLAANDLVTAIPIDAASSYEWKLSEDPNAGQIVTLSESAQPEFELTIADAGTYYLHVRGIDENGLKGFTGAARINVAGTDDSFAPINLGATRDGQDLVINVIDPQEAIPGYEIQLSVTERFEDPVSVDIGSLGAVIFADQQENVFVRARGLLTPSLVTPFGAVLAIR